MTMRCVGLLCLTACAMSLGGCEGVIGLPGGDENESAAVTRNAAGLCTQVGDRLLLRLSSEQYANTLRDLIPGPVGDGLAAENRFPATLIDSGFANDAEANTVNAAEARAIEDNAEHLASRLLADAATALPAVMPCVEPGFGDADVDACVDRFVDEFGQRVYRRPLTDGERTIVRDLYDDIRSRESATQAWASVMQFFLQAPALLYRTERGGDAVRNTRGLRQLNDWEMASRLSYLFLNSMPDSELFAAAAAGELSSPEQVEAQARRLLEDPRSLEAIANFHRDWLHVYALDGAPKDGAAFPELGPEARAAMQTEVGDYLRYVLEDADGTYATLMSTRAFPVDPALASIYGAANPSVPAEMPNRAGLLTLASVMAAHAGDRESNPIERGAFFRREVLCAPIPPLPGMVDLAGPLESTADRPTARERLAPLLERGDCSGCHRLFNPIGYAFENYDAAGRWRADENGTAIDASGQLAVGITEGSFAGPGELMDLVAQAEEGQACYARQWWRFAVGRRETPTDECGLEGLEQEFIASGGDIRELMVAVTQTEAFMFRMAAEEDG